MRAAIFCMLIALALNAKDFKLNPNFKYPYKTDQSKAILQDYVKFMNKIKHKDKAVQMRFVNTYLNGLNAKFDDLKGKEDIWSTRGEFLTKGGGDCEDYSIAKYYSLKDLDFNVSNLCLLIVQDQYSKDYHMVLALWKGKSNPLILDNLSYQILPLKQRIDLRPIECMNENAYYNVDKNGVRTLKKVKYKNYENMLKRQNNEKIWKSKI